MTRSRLTLHEELCTVLGSRNCYFSPPSIMEYPCIKYEREAPDINHADNISYFEANAWMLTIIDTNPDSEIPKRLIEHFPQYCSKNREYATDGLYHFIYRLYY